MNWVTGASFFYDFLEGKVSPGLRTWLAVSRLPDYVKSSNYSGAQFVIEPEVRSVIPLSETLALKSGLGIIIPVSGPIGGTHKSSINGVSLNVGLGF